MAQDPGSNTAHPDTTFVPRIFISHSSADDAFGAWLVDELRRAGVDVWYDSRGRPQGDDGWGGLLPGDDFWRRICYELETRNVFLVIVSPRALSSRWVQDELSMAWQRKNAADPSDQMVIIPVVVTGVDLKFPLSIVQQVTFPNGAHPPEALEKLLSAIRLGHTRMVQLDTGISRHLGPPFEEGLLPPPEPFVGREADLAWVVEHLHAGGATSITPIAALGGMGGIGKSALAAKAIQAVRREDRFNDGVCVIACQGLLQPALVLRQILSRFDSQLGQHDESLTLPKLATKAHSILDGKDVLIVLDNVEPDWPIEEVVAILRATGVTLVLTARQVLPQSAVPAANSYAVGLLPDDEARNLFLSALGRAEVSVAESLAVDRIVKVLDRHTLSVKLAGAYAASTRRDLEAFAQVLERDPLGLPGDNSASQTERAVELVLTRSLESLAPELQELFTAFGALATRETGRYAVVTLARWLGVAQPERGVDLLVRRTLLEAMVLPPMGVPRDRERVQLHPLLWALAQQRFVTLPMVEHKRIKDFIAHYYAWYSHVTYSLALGPDEANLIGCLHWARQAANDKLEAELCSGICEFWRATGRTQVALEEMPRAIDAAKRIAAKEPTRDNRLWAADLEVTYAHVRRDVGELAEAERIFRSDLELRRELQDRWGEAGALGNLGDMERQRGRSQHADQLFQQALDICRELNDRHGVGYYLIKLGTSARKRGQLDQAEKLFQEALVIMREEGDHQSEGEILGHLGHIARNRNQLDDAKRYYEKALAIDREWFDRPGEAIILNNLGYVEEKQGQFAEAESFHQQALTIGREVGNLVTQSYALKALASLARRRGQVAKASSLEQQYRDIKRRLSEQS
jgi:tetratricopeptide (TPR) repeat protein